jgi:Ser/Thr protein kinase RdoA (MazF antagonist)
MTRPEPALEEYLDRMTELATLALAEWDLSGSVLELMKHRENTVFKVTSPAGERFAMRVHRAGYHSDAELASELQWLESLRAAGVATTEAVPCRSGASFAKVGTQRVPEGRQVDMLAWVPGAAIGSVEDGVALDERTMSQVYELAGEQAALIHDHGQNWRRPAGFTRFAWDESGFFGETGSISGRYWDLESLTPDQLGLLHAAREVTAAALAEFGKSPDRYGLVHGDLLPENLFFDGATVRLIDWDDTGFGWHLYDFATAMFGHLGRPSFDLALGSMVAGYRKRRPLPDEHLAMLPVLMMARALSYVGWAHTHGEAADELTPIIVEAACGLAQELLAGAAAAAGSNYENLT